MDYGIAVATTTESWKLVKRAEALGFQYAWFYDTQLLNPDVFIGMTMAALHTSTINLCTGVLVPSNRIEPVAANAFATLNKIAPGRIHFGVGTGYTGRRSMGLRAIKLGRMQRYVERVQKLMRGEVASWNFEGRPQEIGFLNPDYGLINTTDPVPLHVSALGPKARQITAELEAGWLNFGADETSCEKAISHMQHAWHEAGHSPNALYSTLFSLGAVLRPDEALGSQRVIEQAGPYVCVFFHNLVETSEPGEMEPVIGKRLSEKLEAYREVYLAYPENLRHLHNHRGHLMHVRSDERFLITDDLIRAMTFTGEKAELQQRLEQLEAFGYNQFAIQLVEGHGDALEEWAEVFGLGKK